MGRAGEAILGTKEVRNRVGAERWNSPHDKLDLPAGRIVPHHSKLSPLHGVQKPRGRAVGIELCRDEDIRIQDYVWWRHATTPSENLRSLVLCVYPTTRTDSKTHTTVVRAGPG